MKRLKFLLPTLIILVACPPAASAADADSTALTRLAAGFNKVKERIRHLEKLMETTPVTSEFYAALQREITVTATGFHAFCDSVANGFPEEAPVHHYVGMLKTIIPPEGLQLSGEDRLRRQILSAAMEEIYGTPSYQETVNGWLSLYIPGHGKFEGLFGEDMTVVLDNIQNPEIFTGFATDLLVITAQFGWNSDVNVIAEYLSRHVSRLKNPSGIVQRALVGVRVQPGMVAPPVAGPGEHEGPTLLMFYESGCDNCEQAIAQLMRDYERYSAENIRVVTVSADTDENVYESHSKDFPWPDRFCDFAGVSGYNFKSFGVIGTPTTFLIDGNGIIQGRYTGMVRLEE